MHDEYRDVQHWIASEVFDHDLHVRLLGDALSAQPLAFDRRDFKLDQKVNEREEQARIRCPICRWQPTKSSRWYCLPMGAPENFTGGCGKSWHTFDTRGLCPSCRYQWKHTTCPRCGGTSLHEDWYETNNDAASGNP